MNLQSLERTKAPSNPSTKFGLVGALNAAWLGATVYSLESFDTYNFLNGSLYNVEGLNPNPKEASGLWGVHAEAVSKLT